MSQITLVIPPSPFLMDERVFVSLGILKVAAVLETQGQQVEVLDLSGVQNYRDAVRFHVEHRQSQVYGITATTPQMPQAAQIADQIRDLSQARIVLGGPHPTLTNAAQKREKTLGIQGRATRAMNQLLSLFDCVVCGDGELAIFQALDFKEKLLDADDPKGPLWVQPSNLTDLPFPARHLVDLDSYRYDIEGRRATSIIGQLGCPFGCNFSVTGDTLVFTDDGPVEIRTLAQGVGAVRACNHGPSMLSYQLNQPVATPLGRGIATHAVAEGVHPVVRVVAEGGLSIKTTPHHKLMCVVDEQLAWKKSKDLVIGDVLVVRSPDMSQDYIPLQRRTLHKSGLRHSLDKDGWFYTRVSAVEPCLAEPVFDITVPGEEAFVANGFVAHNCGGRNSPFLRRVRLRTSENIIEESRLLTDQGYRGIMFYDDELNVNTKMLELMGGLARIQENLGIELRCRGFIKAQLFTEAQAQAMFRAGFRWILVGFESGSDRILFNIDKQATREENTRCCRIARDHGLKVKALMSIGHAGESHQTVQETRDWLIEVRPEDFDVTVITPYPGSPYYDWAVQNQEHWTFRHKKTGDVLHMSEVDYFREADYYKGIPGEYQSHVWTDHISAQDLVLARDKLESDVRGRLQIPFNPSRPGLRYEASMGQLPAHILRQTRSAP